MKKILLFVFVSFFSFAQSDKDACKTLFQINKLIQEKHYRPKPVDDSLSVYVFNTFIENLDDNNDLFLQSDINELKKFKYKIDNFIKDQNCNFLDAFYNIYSKAITRHQAIITEISEEPIAYSSNEIMKFSKKRFPYYQQENELKKLFKKRLLFDILSDVAQTSENKDSINAVFNDLAAISKIKILENYDCEAKNKAITKEEFHALFLNDFCSYFDPHTMYFSDNEKSNFLSGLSSSNYSFGMDMTLNEKKELSVAEIIPNGAAYYSDKIEVGDILQKIKINGVEYGLKCNNYKETDKVLTANETRKATFTFRKKSGEIYSVELSKQLMRDIENSVYSYVIDYDDNKTGYIKIPSFYSEFENGKTNVSDDVKKEIVRLKDNKITNLIIDLENNTGGSMQEAINLCGFFINAPAVAVTKYANGQPFLMAAQNSKPIFNGKIIILINGYSASASELFANAMQDYNMAVLVGSKSYGKASIQEIFQIENDSKEYLKITIGTFYRVTGKSNQYLGINPTIALPSIFEDQLPREKSEKTALKNEKIQGFIAENSYPLNENQKKVLKNYQLQTIKSETYQKITSLKKRFNHVFTTEIAPLKLNFNAVFEFVNKNNSLFKEIGAFLKTENTIKIYSTSYKFEKSTNDSVLNDSNKIGIKNIKTSFTILESLKILGKLN